MQSIATAWCDRFGAMPHRMASLGNSLVIPLRIAVLSLLLSSPYLTTGCQDPLDEGFSSDNEQSQPPQDSSEGMHCTENGDSCVPGRFCVNQTCKASPIYPPPKELAQQDRGEFRLNDDTLIILPESPSNTDRNAGQLLQDQIWESYGIDLLVRTYKEGDPPENAIVVGSVETNPAVFTLLQDHEVRIPREGPAPMENYAIKVVPSHILVAGEGAPGVLHAAQALKQYIRGVSSMSPDDSLPTITVKDYPDIEQRAFIVIFAHYHFPANAVSQGNTYGYKHMDLPFHIDTARAYLHVLSELRFNTVILKMADMVAWNNMPQPENTAISVQDFLGLVQEANDYGLETIPLLNASSAHYGWIGTVDDPIEFTEEYVLSHNAEHHAIYLALVEEIIQAYEGVQPLRFFHAGLDEDWSLGARPADLHLQWVDDIYSEVTSHGMKMMIWYDNWTKTRHFLSYGQDYPDMRVIVWNYAIPIRFVVKNAVNIILDRGVEICFAFSGNGVPADFKWWSSLQNPRQKGFVATKWVRGTLCEEQTSSIFQETVNQYIWKHANQFWNADHL